MLNSRSPLRTSWPSFTWARISSPPTWAFTDTTLYASTVPIAWIWAGISLTSTTATATGTAGRFGGWAEVLDSALPPEHAAVAARSSAGSRAWAPRQIVMVLLVGLGAPRWPPDPPAFGAPRRSRSAPLYPDPGSGAGHGVTIRGRDRRRAWCRGSAAGTR